METGVCIGCILMGSPCSSCSTLQTTKRPRGPDQTLGAAWAGRALIWDLRLCLSVCTLYVALGKPTPCMFLMFLFSFSVSTRSSVPRTRHEPGSLRLDTKPTWIWLLCKLPFLYYCNLVDWGESRCVGLASFKTLQCLLNMVTIGDSERLSIVLLILSTKTQIKWPQGLSLWQGKSPYWTWIKLLCNWTGLRLPLFTSVFKLTCQRKCIIMTHSCLWQIKLVK